jgi:hypothetical protein
VEGISCFQNVPEHHDPVEPYFGPELYAGDLLDGRFAIVETVSRSGVATIIPSPEPGTGKLNRCRQGAAPAFGGRSGILFPFSTRGRDWAQAESSVRPEVCPGGKKKPALHRN